MSAEKTENATHKRLREARKKGQVARSPEVVSAAGFGALLVYLFAAGGPMASELARQTQQLMALAFAGADHTRLLQVTMAAATSLTWFLAPIVGVAAALAVLSGTLQVRGVFAFDPVVPKLEHVNPMAGIKRIFSGKTLSALLIILVKVALTLSATWAIVSHYLKDLLAMRHMTPEYIAIAGATIGMYLLGSGLLILLVFAAVDLLVQNHWFAEEMKMSKQEVRRDYKDTEGDPLTKSRRRSEAFQALFGALRDKIKSATVVIVNPTHVSVAIRFAPGQTPLPMVVAKGVDEQALIIRQLAREHGVMMLADIPLARRLYAEVLVDDYIHEDLFDAVAAVLAYVESLRGELARDGEPLPDHANTQAAAPTSRPNPEEKP